MTWDELTGPTDPTGAPRPGPSGIPDPSAGLSQSDDAAPPKKRKRIRPGTGRPTGRPVGSSVRLTPAVRDRILELVRDGNFKTTAARAVGIPHSTLGTWLQKAREGAEPYASFARDLEVARAESEANALATIKSAAPKSWQAAAWFLERAFPDRWRMREQAHAKDANHGPMSQVVVYLPAKHGPSADEHAQLVADAQASYPDAPVVSDLSDVPGPPPRVRINLPMLGSIDPMPPVRVELPPKRTEG